MYCFQQHRQSYAVFAWLPRAAVLCLLAWAWVACGSQGTDEADASQGAASDSTGTDSTSTDSAAADSADSSKVRITDAVPVETAVKAPVLTS